MIKKVEHIGIAVKNLEESGKLYQRLLGISPYKRETVESEGVVTLFFKTGESKIELLASIEPGGVIARFIEKHGEGIHHIAFETDDIEAELERLKREGFTLIHEKPKAGADNKLVAFVHPKSAGGVLVELCQERED